MMTNETIVWYFPCSCGAEIREVYRSSGFYSYEEKSDQYLWGDIMLCPKCDEEMTSSLDLWYKNECKISKRISNIIRNTYYFFYNYWSNRKYKKRK